MSFVIPFLYVLFSCVVIKYACDGFEQSASYLGRNMGAGARGALVDAIGSSLPELLVTLMFVISGNPELILGGISVTAGSAIFNAVLIPAFAILFAKEDGKPVNSFKLDRKVILRDGIYLLIVEGLLIWFLGMSTFSMVMTVSLLAAYAIYATHVIFDSNKCEVDEDCYEYESLESCNMLSALCKFDFNKLLFKDKPLTKKTALVIMLLSVGVIGFACHILTEGIVGVSEAFSVPLYFSAVVLGAAATSVPDTLLSIKSAQRGDFEDAVGNAIGSNIFDVTVSLALPIFLYLTFSGTEGLPIIQSTDLVGLRLFVLGTSAFVIGLLWVNAKNINKKVSWALFGTYGVWIGYILTSII